MANEKADQHDSVGAWAKRYYFASRAVIESVLRAHGLGTTQWYVLYQLANDGPTLQRDLAVTLQIERATLSGVVSTLVRKGLVSQEPDPADQRQRLLRLTPAGEQLWRELPDPVADAQATSLAGMDAADLATAVRVLKAATRRLSEGLPRDDA